MNRDPEQLLKDANPLRDQDLEMMNLSEAEESLKQSILETSRAADGEKRARTMGRAGLTAPIPGRRLLPVTAVAGALAAVFLAVALISAGGGPDSDGTNRAWATELVKAVDSTPRLLLESDRWQMYYVYQDSAKEGQISYENGPRKLDINWYRKGHYSDILDDRKATMKVVGERNVPGGVATVLDYREPEVSGNFSAIWQTDAHAIEVRNFGDTNDDLLTLHEFDEILDSLKSTSTSRWLAGLPESVVRPAETRAVADEMLAGIPLPPGLDRDEIAAEELASDRYQLGARVSGAVACGWIDDWVAAKRAGNAKRKSKAEEALASSHGWPILKEMASEGAYPDVLWELADAVNGDGTVVGGMVATVEETYRQALGCGPR